MKYPERKVKAVADLLSHLKAHWPTRGPAWFRGHADLSWRLLPSLYRMGRGVDTEQALLKRFKQNALPFLERQPQDDWEWLFLMQHHGVPTRLLDWTESPLVALYFSLEDQGAGKETEGALWALLPLELNKSANITTELSDDIPGFGADTILDLYKAQTILAQQQTALKPVATIAQRNSRRMQAQQGVFTLSHQEQIALEELKDGKHVWRYRIPKDSKQQLRQELRLLNIRPLSLFPELANVAAQAREYLDG